MSRLLLLSAMVAVSAGCQDQETTVRAPQPGVLAPTIAAPVNPPPPSPEALAARADPVIKRFDAEVVAKKDQTFTVRALSGRHYLIVATIRLTNKPPDDWAAVNFDQIEVGQRLRLLLSHRIPLAPAYTCDFVYLWGARASTGVEILLGEPLKDED